MRFIAALLVSLGVMCSPVWAQGVSPAPTLAQMGIPAPSFGLNETVTSEYGSDTYATIWVDNTVSCTDTANPAGTSGNPRCTFPTMTSLAAGSVVQGCGTFARGTSDLTITASGTAADPVFFRQHPSCVGGLNFTFSGAGNFVANSSTYLIIEDIAITSVQGMTIQSASYVALRDSNISGSGNAADSGEMIGIGSSNNIVRARNIVHDGGDWLSATENDTHCLAIASNETYIWDLWNTAYHCSGDGSGNGHDANHTTHHLYIGGNEFYSNRENCIDLKEVHDLIISRNWCHDIAASSSSPGEAIVIHYGPTSGDGPYNTWTRDNLLEDVVTGVAFSGLPSGTGPNYVIANTIRNCTTGVAFNGTSSPSAGFRIYHNTFDGCAVGLLFGSTAGTRDVGGNIVINASSRHLRTDTTAISTNLTINKELYYQGGSNVAIGWSSSTALSYTSVASWISGTGKGTGSLQADPLFVGASDYRLQAGSPARGAGLDMSSVSADYTTLWGTSLNTDAGNVARPSSGAWDMGARQYDSGADVTAPVVTITGPASTPTYSVGAVPTTALAGSASDAVGVSSVTWACPTCTPASGTATGTTSWSVATVTLASGANVITVTATDAATNAGTDVITITYTPPASTGTINFRRAF